ncbi:Branched-chain amino acid ABC transporter, periplasmic amino acid-binding protein, putative [Leucobacter sp. 7(1)]|uniref:ABC transporter substrate-binding protein n=1 Tax=Leucobacter sp. 7(1) TaxID=1255613 RepID=UPI00097EB095|nr:ABC transporter substrate-binding protein [Leucobacter sp. 7(1)]SJN08733.1 Branched-chain amino acid ABC transporter, periplasmic amino acid-binding protein, putative [Leucobacter sp. 7(1)]
MSSLSNPVLERRTRHRGISAAAILLAAALGTSGCVGAAPTDSSEVIRLGSVNTLSGPATFSEAPDAAAAVFDRVNAAGGIHGRMIEYLALDDKGDPATATALARELVSSEEVLALVGGGSLLDCEVNAGYYEQTGIRSIQGLGVDPGCFESPNIAPTNIGPFNDTTLTMLFGSERLGLSRLCVFTSIVGSTAPAYREAIGRWSEITGKDTVFVDETVPYGAPEYSAPIVRAREAGCDAIVSNAGGPDAVGQVLAANQQGWEDITFLFLTGAFSAGFASAIDDSAAGVYVPAEFYPFTEANGVTAAWRTLMNDNDIELTSFSQGGYLAATFMVEVLEGIDGEITRDSVNEALATMQPIENDMLAYPYEFGRIAGQDYEPGGWPVVLRSGTNAWERASEDWLTIPSH